MLEKPKKSRRVLSVFVLAMLNVSVMASLRNLPLVAEYGLGAVFYFVLVALLFLVPCALISAELATGWPKTGGISVWSAKLSVTAGAFSPSGSNGRIIFPGIP